MDRLELRTKFASRIDKFRLEEFEVDVYLRPLSALERAKIVDKYRALEKIKEAENALETLTVEAQCYIVSRGLVDAQGARTYKDEEAQSLAEEFPCKALDAISRRILEISGMSAAADPVKNSDPTPNADSSFALQ